jgi:hypothetical protein
LNGALVARALGGGNPPSAFKETQIRHFSVIVHILFVSHEFLFAAGAWPPSLLSPKRGACFFIYLHKPIIGDKKDCKYGTEFELLVFIIATITQRHFPLRIDNSSGNFSLSAV